MSFHQEAQQVVDTVQDLGKRRGRADPVRVRQLPAGTVTFVFTDIEGSTRLQINPIRSKAKTSKSSLEKRFAFVSGWSAIYASSMCQQVSRPMSNGWLALLDRQLVVGRQLFDVGWEWQPGGVKEAVRPDGEQLTRGPSVGPQDRAAWLWGQRGFRLMAEGTKPGGP
jgi:hypothetical protein